MLKKIQEKFNELVLPTISLEKEIVGIDLSHNYLRVVQLTNKKNVWSLTRFASRVLEAGSLTESQRMNLLLDLLKEIKQRQRFDTHNAAISLPINDAIVQIVQIPYLDDDLLRTAVENGSLWQSYINLPGDLSEYSVFWQIIKSDPDNNQMSILFVASSLAKVDAVCKVVKEAGFNPVFVDVRCFALRNVLKLYGDNEPQEPSVFLEVSGYENYMVFIYNDLPFVYDIFVTDSDVKALISLDGNIDSAACARISSQIADTINLFLRQSGASGIGDINLVSSFKNIDQINNGLIEYLAPNNIQILNAFQHLKISDRFRLQLNSEVNLSAFSVALGLATRRLDVLSNNVIKAVANINLLPNRYDLIEAEKKSSKSQIRSNKIAAYFFIVALIFSGVFALMLFTLPSEDELIALEANNVQLQSKLDKSKSLLKEYSHWINDVETPNRKITSLKILSEIPDGVYVLEFKKKRKDTCEILLQSKDPSLVSVVIDKMSEKYKNVKLISVESDADNAYQISKVIFQIK